MKALALFYFVLLLLPTSVLYAQSGLDFNGVDDKATVAHHNDFNLGTGDFTIELKVKSIANLKNKLTLLSKRGTLNSGFDLEVTTTGNQGKFTINLGNTSKEIQSSTLKNGQCHFLAVRRENGQIRMFLDNTSQNRGNANVNISSLVNLLIGQDGIATTAGGSNPLDGLIEEIRIWNIARTNAEISASNNSCILGSEPGLVAYWNLEENSGQVLHDKANRHHAILGTDYQSESFDPTWIAGSCLASCSPTTAYFQSDKNPIYSGQHVTFSNSSTAATEYEWRIDNSPVLSTDMDVMAYMTEGVHTVELRAFEPSTNQYSYWTEVYFVTEFFGVPGTPQYNAAHSCSMHSFGVGGIPIEGCGNPTSSTPSSILAAPSCIGHTPIAINPSNPNDPAMTTAAHFFNPASIRSAGGFRLIFQDLECSTQEGFDEIDPIPNSSSLCFGISIGQARVNTAVKVFESISDLLGIGNGSGSIFNTNAMATSNFGSTPAIEIYFKTSTLNQSYLADSEPYYHLTSQGGFQGGFVQQIFTTLNTLTPPYIFDPDPDRADGAIVIDFGSVLINAASCEHSHCHLVSPCGNGAASSTEFDLYSIILHEALHIMGFISAIDYDSESILALTSDDYTLYDKMLLNSRD